MLELYVLLVLVVLSAFFSAAETALTSVSRPRIAHLVETKKKGARALRKLREDPAKMLTSILVGNNLVNISASVLATTIITDYFEKLGMKEEGLIIGIIIGIMTFFLLVFGEVTPKTVAIRNAEKTALLFAPVMLFFEIILLPIAWLITLFSRPFIFAFGGKIPELGPFITEEEIKTLLFVGEKEGTIEREEREMISSVFKFGDLRVNQVMTPLEKMVGIDLKQHISDAIAKIKESGHSRLPVFDQNKNNIVGILFAKDLLLADKKDTVEEYLRPVLFIPAVKKVGDVMEQMQAEYKHLAIVIDEFGRTQGIVSLEDLLEEIVGEIHDEFERRQK